MMLPDHAAGVVDLAGCGRAGLADQRPAAKGKVLLVGSNPITRSALTCLARLPDARGNTQTQRSGAGRLRRLAQSPRRLERSQNDLVVYATPAAEFLLDGPHRDEFMRLMKEGVGLVTIHWASSIHQQDLDRLGDRWMSYLGGTWISNVGLSTTTSPLRQLAANHPVCRGWSEYELLDEYYLNPKIVDARPLLQVTTHGQEVVAGWAYERPDGGRSYATTLGHFYSNFDARAVPPGDRERHPVDGEGGCAERRHRTGST